VRILPGFRGNRSASWSLWVLIVISLLALLAPILPLEDPATPDLDRKVMGPGWPGLERGQLTPMLCTDQLGRCLLSRIVWGSRVSLSVGLLSSLVSLILGVTYGAVSGFAGGRVDSVMMRLVDMLYALPLMFIVIFVVTFLRGVQSTNPDFPLSTEVVLFAVIGAVSWLVMARLVRGQVLSLKETAFVDAARAAGSGPLDILIKHLLPNLLPLILVTLTLTIPRVILMEAFLSFLGLGVDAPDVSWGLLAQEGFGAVTAVHVSWWLIVFPGIFLGATLHALNTLGDRLRDLLDPVQKGESPAAPQRGTS